MARVIGSEQVEQARAGGRAVLEILPGDIVTDIARESAVRLGIRLVDGPLPRPTVARTDGATQARRGLYRRVSAPGKSTMQSVSRNRNG